MDDVAAIAAGLTKSQREALMALAELLPADPTQWRAAVTYGNSWRKAAKHRVALLTLHGLVETTERRAETLWRLTKPLGLAVRKHIMENDA